MIFDDRLRVITVSFFVAYFSLLSCDSDILYLHCIKYFLLGYCIKPKNIYQIYRSHNLWFRNQAVAKS